MNAQRPTFTVIVPTHKRAVLLERALSSIRAQALDQLIEIIVISDAADAATNTICDQYLTSNDIYLKRNGAAGPSASRNIGLKLAQGQHIIFLDDDDAWHPNYLQTLLSNPAYLSSGVVFSNCSVVKERRLPAGPEFLSEQALDLSQSLNFDVYVKNQVHMSCYVFPKHILDGLEFDPYMRAYEDWDFLLSVFDRQMPKHIPILSSRVYEVSDETTDRRGSSKGAQDFNAVLDYLYVYRRHPLPRHDIPEKRAQLLKMVGLDLANELL